MLSNQSDYGFLLPVFDMIWLVTHTHDISVTIKHRYQLAAGSVVFVMCFFSTVPVNPVTNSRRTYFALNFSAFIERCDKGIYIYICVFPFLHVSGHLAC